MLARVRRWAMLTGGWFFVALGITGLFLPILQGILFILIGLLILSSEYVWAHRLLERVKQRFPKLADHVNRCGTRSAGEGRQCPRKLIGGNNAH
jgi:uncharacterized membrane protein YbaN (DUF454 family)